MAGRVTQSAIEALEGIVNAARVTQAAVEALESLVPATAPRVTQVAVEALESITGPLVAAEIRETQAALEYAHRTDGVDQTQVALEVLQKSPPAAAVNETQAALEHIWLRPNETWESQVCLEVIGPGAGGGGVPLLRNYAWTGLLARTDTGVGVVETLKGIWATQACLEVIYQPEMILESAYFVVSLSRTGIPVGDLPPVTEFMLSGTGRITTLDTNIDNWFNFSPAHPNPVHGAWNPSTTYAIGNTVSSANYSIKTSADVVLAPLTYRSLRNGNVGHNPDNYEGWWTCITQPPHNLVSNKNYVPVSFGYVLSPLPTPASLAATHWRGKFWHSLSWSVPDPGDIVQLIDMYVKLNYRSGGSIVPVLWRPQSAQLAAPNTGAGRIINPGITAQFQTWFTSGFADFPILDLYNFLPVAEDSAGTVRIN